MAELDMKIEKSTCEKMIRFQLGEHVVIIPIGEWSKFLATPGAFEYQPKVKNAHS